MKRKNSTIMLSLLTLLSTTTFVVSGLSFAWIKWNTNVDNKITLTSGTDVLTVEYYAYLEYTKPDGTLNRVTSNTTQADAIVNKDNQGNYQTSATTGTITAPESTGGAIEVTYSPVFNPDILNFYLDETSVHYDPLPKMFFEIRYIKETSDGYLKGHIVYKDTTKDGQKIVPSNMFQYRILPTTQYLTNGYKRIVDGKGNVTYQEDLATSDYSCALKQGYDALVNNTGLSQGFARKPLFNDNPVNNESKISLFEYKDLCNPNARPDLNEPAHATGTAPGSAGRYNPPAGKFIDNQCFVPHYQTHYSKATLVEISLNEELFKKEALKHLAAPEGSQYVPMEINMNFTFDFEFSNSPYYVDKDPFVKAPVTP